MSEQPTQRFERPPVPPADPDAATTEYQPVYPEDDYNPLFDPPPATAPPADPPPVTPPVAPPPVAAPPSVEPAADPAATQRVAGAPPAYDATEPPRAAPKRGPSPNPSVAASIARQWFSQSDNVLMAVTAIVAAVFLMLVAVLP